MHAAGQARPTGALGLTVIRGDGRTHDLGVVSPPPVVPWPARELTYAEILRFGRPHRGLPAEVNRWRRRNRPHLARGLRKLVAARTLRLPHFYGQLFLTVLRGDGQVLEHGRRRQSRGCAR